MEVYTANGNAKYIEDELMRLLVAVERARNVLVEGGEAYTPSLHELKRIAEVVFNIAVDARNRHSRLMLEEFIPDTFDAP